MNRLPRILASLVLASVGLQAALAQSGQLNLGDRIGIDQKLGDQVPLDTPVMDEHGKQIKLGDVLNGRPVVFMPIFYTCQGVCGVELSNMLKSAIKMKKTFAIGDKFDLVVLSINPKETPDLALAKERDLQNMYYVSNSPDHSNPADLPSTGWHLLTGTSEANIRKVTDSLGFRYEYKPATDQINHPSGIMILTPQGKISSYIYGADYPTKVLQDSLELANQGKVGAKAEVILLGCIMVDPVTGKRTLMVERVLKFAGILTVLILGISILKMSIDSKKNPAGGGTSPVA